MHRNELMARALNLNKRVSSEVNLIDVGTWYGNGNSVLVLVLVRTLVHPQLRVIVWSVFEGAASARLSMDWNCGSSKSIHVANHCHPYTRLSVFIAAEHPCPGGPCYGHLSKNGNSQKSQSFCRKMGILVIQSESSGIFGDCV